MSPINKKNKSRPADNLYTALLGFGFSALLATAIFTAVMCYLQYETLFKIQ